MWLVDRLPRRVITGDRGAPYLERYAVLVLGRDENPWFSLYLHRFVSSDPDRGLHDHPWAWAAGVVLAGHYWEERFGLPPVRRAVGSLGWFGPSYQHRVVLPEESGECWTLFCHGRRVSGWGFWRVIEKVNGDHRAIIYRAMAKGPADNQHGGWWKSCAKGAGVAQATECGLPGA